MPVVIVLAVLVLLVASAVGALVLRAGRQLDEATVADDGAPVAPQGSVAARVDASLQRTRTAVEELVRADLDTHEPLASPSAHRYRAHTYTVLGIALLGLAGAALVGLLLFL